VAAAGGGAGLPQASVTSARTDTTPPAEPDGKLPITYSVYLIRRRAPRPAITEATGTQPAVSQRVVSAGGASPSKTGA
jgi:hypothetical protein